MKIISLLSLFLAVAVSTEAADTTSTDARLAVALYGSNGHQLRPAALIDHPHARLVAVAAVREHFLPPGSPVRRYASLDDILADPEVQLVSLCSPRRADQARDAIQCLEAGKHVYAEKPAALTERELDAVLAAAKRSGREFHEMTGTALVQPYLEMRRLVDAGAIGEVIQVLAQKSYPYGTTRPQNEVIDGGLMLQVGIHAMRMVVHVAGQRVHSISGLETGLGNPEVGAVRMAAALQMQLENGGLATIIANYLNPPHLQPRGHETLRIFGTKGFIESVDGGLRTRLVTHSEVLPLDTSEPSRNFFDLVAAHLMTGAPLPFTLEEELHPLRMLLRAKDALDGAIQHSGTRTSFTPIPRRSPRRLVKSTLHANSMPSKISSPTTTRISTESQ